MLLGGSFNVDEMPIDDTNFDPIPEGWYKAKITAASLENTRNNTGRYISIKYTILGPDHAGRVIFGNINIENQSQAAQEIGLKQFRSLLVSIGYKNCTDTDELLTNDLMIKVKVRPANEKYDASNDVVGFKAIEGSSLPAPNQQQPSQPAKDKPAWLK